MGGSFSWPVSQPAAVGVIAASNTSRVVDPLGCGLIRPFYRIPTGDFNKACGIKEVLSCVGQVFGTRKGHLPWRQGFGSDLERLRHKGNTAVLAETARVFVEDALTKWEPRAQVTFVKVDARKPGEENLVPLLIGTKIGGLAQAIRVTV